MGYRNWNQEREPRTGTGNGNREREPENGNKNGLNVWKGNLMDKRHQELLRLLTKSGGPQTAKDLAASLNISVRTVRSYVAEINKSQTVIRSGKSGYLLETYFKPETSPHNNLLPQTFEERAVFMIKRLLIERYYVDIYELAEELCISDATCRSDLMKMNKIYGGFDLRFFVKHNFPQISGDEKNKRRLIQHIISREVSDCFFSLSMLKDMFESINVELLFDTVNHVFSKNQYYSNDFAKRNLVLGLAVTLTRIQKNQYLSEKTTFDEASPFKHTREYKIALNLCAEIESQFALTFHEQEIHDLYFLIKTTSDVIFDPDSTREPLEHYMGDEICRFVDEVLEAVSSQYHINLENEVFYVPFCMHVKKLLYRIKENSQINNPMTESIKTAYPLLYDMAVYVSALFSSRLNVELNEDETSFLAIHFGGEIERQKTSESVVKAVLFCPEYLDMQKNLYQRIISEFGNRIEIIKSISNEDELSDDQELVIITVPILKQLTCPVCQISLFFHSSDKTTLFYGIETILSERNKRFLREHFDKYFQESLFFPNSVLSTREDCIAFMCGELVKHQYVEEAFPVKVRERESLASTAFDNLAIPHAMEQNAYKTGICVLRSQNGIDWGGKKVNLVLMVAISAGEKSCFGSVYEAIVENFSNAAFLDSVMKSGDFQQFRALFCRRYG